MHQCNYVILDYCKSNLSLECAPCLLLLDSDSGMHKTPFGAFVSPNIAKWLDEMSNPGRNWMLGFLSDVCERQHSSKVINNIGLEQFCSMGVGPLRTSIHNVIQVNGTDNILDLICAKLETQGLHKFPEERCQIRSFRELDAEMLRKFRERFVPTNSNKSILKNAAQSVGVLAFLRLTS